MFWVLRRSIFSDKAAAFFNVLNNNHKDSSMSTTGNSKVNITKNAGYNKLSSHDEYLLDKENGNIVAENHVQTNFKDKFDDIIDLNATSDYEEELTDDSDYDESLTCNVCDRSFYSRRTLEQHQQKKRHFGCSACDTIFPSVMQLEHHKEEFDHWSDSETSALTCRHFNHCRHRGSRDADLDSEDSFMESGEEMERLL